MNLEEYYSEFDAFTRWYMATYGASGSSLDRILQRLHIDPTSSDAESHAAIRDYLRAHGERVFKVRVGVLPTGSDSYPDDSTPIPIAGFTVREGAKDAIGALNFERADGQLASRTAVADLPEVLQGYLPSIITPEALKAAAEGLLPFGPPPLIDRRGGERRSGHDRRRMVDLVFCNRRELGERRGGMDRRRAA